MIKTETVLDKWRLNGELYYHDFEGVKIESLQFSRYLWRCAAYMKGRWLYSKADSRWAAESRIEKIIKTLLSPPNRETTLK